MNKRIIIGSGAAVLLLCAAGGAAIAAGSDDEGTVTGPQADKAARAALEATEGGNVNAIERDGENGATWEVEVTREDGTTVDVRLDEHFSLVVIEGDSEDADTGDGDG